MKTTARLYRQKTRRVRQAASLDIYQFLIILLTLMIVLLAKVNVAEASQDPVGAFLELKSRQANEDLASIRGSVWRLSVSGERENYLWQNPAWKPDQRNRRNDPYALSVCMARFHITVELRLDDFERMPSGEYRAGGRAGGGLGGVAHRTWRYSDVAGRFPTNSELASFEGNELALSISSGLRDSLDDLCGSLSKISGYDEIEVALSSLTTYDYEERRVTSQRNIVAGTNLSCRDGLNLGPRGRGLRDRYFPDARTCDNFIVGARRWTDCEWRIFDRGRRLEFCGDVFDLISTAGSGAAPSQSSARPSGDLVRSIQNLLKSFGVDPGPVDGVMGAKTRAAIETCERRMGRPVTGQPSEDLRRMLAERGCR